MQDRFNTAAGWVLFSGIVALGLSSVSAKYFQGNHPERPEKMGYPIEGVVEEGEGGADAGPSLAVRLASGDAAAGEKAATGRCGTCHSFDQGGGVKQGPNLYGTVGEPIGKGKAGFAFSSALSGHGGNWTYENLFDWLKSPSAFAAGTKMTFAGLSNPQDRANVIAYLKQQGGGPDYPAPAAAAGAAKADAAAAKAPDAGPGAAVSGAPANPVEAAGGAGQPAPVPGKASDSNTDASQAH